MATPSVRRITSIAALALALATMVAQPATAGEPVSGFAVVELFTSEGCSSCPPADDVLARLDAWAQQNGRPVYALSFHVDYWNRLGWTDPYSAAAFTDRQREYAARAGERSVYTPQMIVNGAKGFVGSDAKLATTAVSRALDGTGSGNLRLMVAPDDAGPVRFAYESTGLGNATLNAALVQPVGTQAVTLGENAGRRLRHVNVVRAFRSIDLDPSGTGEATIERPPGIEGPLRVIVYAQQRRTQRVLAAASAPAP